jgi:hypothetical protein
MLEYCVRTSRWSIVHGSGNPMAQAMAYWFMVVFRVLKLLLVLSVYVADHSALCGAQRSHKSYSAIQSILQLCDAGECTTH